MPENEQYSFIKWLRYYLDFCHKYGLKKTGPNSLPLFIEKLRSKSQVNSDRLLMLLTYFIQFPVRNRLIKPLSLRVVKWTWLPTRCSREPLKNQRAPLIFKAMKNAFILFMVMKMP